MHSPAHGGKTKHISKITIPTAAAPPPAEVLEVLHTSMGRLATHSPVRSAGRASLNPVDPRPLFIGMALTRRTRSDCFGYHGGTSHVGGGATWALPGHREDKLSSEVLSYGSHISRPRRVPRLLRTLLVWATGGVPTAHQSLRSSRTLPSKLHPQLRAVRASASTKTSPWDMSTGG